MRLTNVVILFFLCKIVFAQSPSLFTYPDTLSPKRFKGVLITEGALALSSIVVLNEVWYKNYPQSRFHFFDDSNEWLYMDKLGHITTSYYMGLASIELMKWSGVSSPKRAWIGGALGFVYLTGVEILDGKSSQWGFSIADCIANGIGASAVIGQDILWSEQRIRFKVSAHLTDYAQFRPNLLGSTFAERLLKDYNGQTIWASINIASFLGRETFVPQWLNIAIGYSAEELLSGRKGIPVVYRGNDISNLFNRYSQYYLSLDIDLSRIKISNPYLNALLKPFGLIKIPFPALEFSKHGVKGYAFYF